ncbi:hypothetical protein POVCU2_0024890 [Plasmodium ovale curtisi]|uniref:Uncharacterized protein n=1 Tax=Plasmodium ovale curtisi TaxID=864141 RepID=A0A1A8VXV6_PLAOA|nr:hypothetical protein POVCU2_0024890 [Plasmodium ovale curtisi]SBS92361.1 hypothetical protein POVCU1_022700 [Plasmodium ovale curtisi]
MSKFCEPSKNDKEKYCKKNFTDFTVSNKSTRIYIQEDLSKDDDGRDSDHLDGINDKLMNADMGCMFGNVLKRREKDINSDVCSNVIESCTNNSFFKINKINVKIILRYIADCCSFLCAVGIWGVLEDILRILSKENYYVKLYYYLIFTILFTSFTCSFNLYLSKNEHESNCICNDLERQE